ncbi:MAG: ATP-binding cassette domain-containing protein [Alphaproteobacteria bacterium]|nr:ATP-binding cassette domain-containing protein [Alphaproteobacteria bacterium]
MNPQQIPSKILISNLKKSFGSKHVLRGLNLEVSKGESVVIIGGSGTGKSVLLKCILGLIKPDSGSIKIDGQELRGSSRKLIAQAMTKISMLFQSSALFDSLPVWENVAFLLLQRRQYKRQQAKEMAIQQLAAVGLNERVADLFPSEISGGMQRRVALARAVIHKPEIIFFDEPTAGLDPIFSSVINSLIVKCVKELGATAITITHDMVSARHVGDRIAMLHEGKIIWDGPAKGIEHSKNPYVDQFINGQSDGPIKIEV